MNKPEDRPGRDVSRRVGLTFLMLAIGGDLLLAITGHTVVIRAGYGIVAVLIAIGGGLGYRQGRKKTQPSRKRGKCHAAGASNQPAIPDPGEGGESQPCDHFSSQSSAAPSLFRRPEQQWHRQPTRARTMLLILLFCTPYNIYQRIAKK